MPDTDSTRTTPIAVAAMALLLGLGLSGCGFSGGDPTTQTRQVDTFTRIDNDSSVDVVVRAGDRQQVRVRAGDKVIDDIRTEVHDDTLHIGFEHHGMFGGGDKAVEVTAPRIDAVANGGSGDLDAREIDGGRLTVRLDGSGDIDLADLDVSTFDARATGSGDLEATGMADRVRLSVTGSGEGDLEDLTARDAELVASGSGDVEVQVSERLDARLTGSGDVTYHGDPTVERDVSGSGELEHATS